jgi:hypothetical protein
MSAPDKTPTALVQHSAAVEAGPILSAHAGDTTTIWRDGEVIREDVAGRAWLLPSINPISTAANN